MAGKKEGRTPITVNLEDAILAWIDGYGRESGLDRATCIRTLVFKGKKYVEQTEGKWRPVRRDTHSPGPYPTGSPPAHAVSESDSPPTPPAERAEPRRRTRK